MVYQENSEDHQRLIDLLKRYSLKTGEEFTLLSGKKSPIYVDVKETALSRYVYPLLAKMLYQKICAHFIPSWGFNIDAIAGIELGGCHLASIVAMHSDIPLDVIYVRKQPKNYGTKNLIEKPELKQGAKVVLLEDVITTGHSVIRGAQILEESGLKVQGTLAVVDRREDKSNYLDKYPFFALVDFEELT